MLAKQVIKLQSYKAAWISPRLAIYLQQQLRGKNFSWEVEFCCESFWEDNVSRIERQICQPVFRDFFLLKMQLFATLRNI